MKALLLALLCACCSRPASKTPESMLAHRLSAATCARVCPVGRYLAPVPEEPGNAHTLDDCCVDPFGLTWSSCAWDAAGQHLTRAELMDPARLDGFCGGDEFPDCEGP